jgi:hypothetical protein
VLLNEKIYLSNDGGDSWIYKTPSGGRLSSIAMSSDGSKIIVCDFDTSIISTSYDSGTTWTNHSTGYGGSSWSAVTSSSDGSKLVAAAVNQPIYTSQTDNIGGISGTSSSADFLYSGNGEWLVVGNQGKLVSQ